MDGEIGVGGKALAALVTAEGFLARVRPAMGGESAVAGKTLTALVATEDSVLDPFGRLHRTRFILVIQRTASTFSQP
jgi:hypothetical protein